MTAHLRLVTDDEWDVDQLAARTVRDYVEAHGPVSDDDLELVVRLALEVAAAQKAYQEGRADERAALKAASLEIGAVLPGKAIIAEAEKVGLERAWRAVIGDSSPRPNDRPGRRG